DGWPEGSGNVERPGMGPEKLDNGVYYMRALYDLADMAKSKGDSRTFAWATGLAAKLRAQFEGTWWDTAAQQYADSLIDPGNQQRYTDAIAETMFSEPATGNTPDEQPGALPEIFPSTPSVAPGSGIPPNIDRCWTCRSMVMQAWDNYGTAWSVIHQQLGVRP